MVTFINGNGKDYNMICKLCLKEKPLIKAHIIPDFLYKNLGLYEADSKGQGRIHVARIQNNRFYYNPKGISDGEYDQNILCSNCDNVVLQAYEDYAKKVLFDGNYKLPEFQHEYIKDSSLGCEYGLFKNVDYTKFKLFLLSIFWRASISARVFSGEVKFGEKINEGIRKMLFDKDPKDPEDFCTILYFLNEPDITLKLMTNFKKIENNNSTRYAFIAGGMIFKFFLNKNDIPENHKPFIFSKSGELKIFNMPKDKIRLTLNDFFEEKLF